MNPKHDTTQEVFRKEDGGVMDGPCVAILLSTFNGERYLDEQLRGYSGQTHANWLLYWRDDGSCDASAPMVEAFANGAGAGAGRCLRHTTGINHTAGVSHTAERRPATDKKLATDERLGATESFLALARMALAGPAALFAFSDQDDVWLPEKLAHGAAALRMVPEGQPALYFCARTLVDEALRPLGQAPLPRHPLGFPDVLTQNAIPGCCMLLNRAAAERIDALPVPEDTWHDWWACLVVAAHEGVIIAGDTPDILYRQHARNLVGERLGSWRRAVAALRRGRTGFMARFWRHVAALQAGAGHLPEGTRDGLALLNRARQGGVAARFRALRGLGLARRTWLETLLFRLWFLLDRGPCETGSIPCPKDGGVPKSLS